MLPVRAHAATVPKSERRARERLTKAKRLCNWAERDSLPQAARRAAPEGAGKGMLHPRPHLGFGPFELYGEFFDHAFRHGFDFPPLGRHLPLDAEASRGDLAPRGSPRNFSRRVTFFFPAYSDCAKLICCFIPARLTLHFPRRWRLNQCFSSWLVDGPLAL